MKQNLSISGLRDISKPCTVISLFSGIGSRLIGYGYAGFHTKIAVGTYETAKPLFLKNFPLTKYLTIPIQSLSPEFLLTESKLEVTELDILDISPPASFFELSRSGQTEEQKALWRKTLEIIKFIQPKVFILYFPKRLLLKRTQLLINEFQELLQFCDYRVHHEFLNSKHYNVPQEREYMVIMAVRNDLDIKPTFPESLPNMVCTKDVLEDIMHAPIELKMNPSREAMLSLFKPGITEEEVDDILSENNLSVQKGNYKRDKWEEPYYELKKTFTRPIHPKIDRVLSVWEAMRIQTIPDDFHIAMNPSFNWQSICASSPPLFIYHIGKTIKEDILDRY